MKSVLAYILTLKGDPARFQRRGGHSSGDPTQKSFPFHSKFWPTGSLFLFLGTYVRLIHINNWFSLYYVSSQVVSRETMPKSMLEQYLACDKPPPLDKLNPYRWAFLFPTANSSTMSRKPFLPTKSLFREDGKDGLKFYTDANYFFDLWRSEMLQSTEKASAKRGGLR